MPIYMKIEGVKGSAVGKYKDWIELSSAQLSSGRSVNSAAGRGVNREASAPSLSEIVVTKSNDIASTQLFQLSLRGEGKKVVIHFVGKDSKGEVPYMALELENALISSYSVSGHGGTAGDRPMESLSLNFTKITYSTTPVAASADAKVVKDRAMWNLAIGAGS
ncbi:Hcp family type VI secretion system effector [Paludisphaera soli]|uniref:Hcp family type VI secretion system effector n=1 Tax=Paludisphaera soli TaxID=2712865 RepID=UPI0013EDD612|nr:type VI secretion system tube protein Hcp [Paludisphaera soli]